MFDRRTFLAGSAGFAATLWLPERAVASTAPLPKTAIHSDAIGPAAEVAEIRLYSRPAEGRFRVTGSEELTRALEQAGSGDTILLAPGRYGEFSTRASAGRGRIRVVSEQWRGATFDKIFSGGDGIWWEGVDVTGENLVVRGRNVGLRHVRAPWLDLRNFTDATIEDSIFDGEYAGQSNIKEGSGATVRRTIFSRGSGPDLLQTGEVEDMDFENCVFFDLRVPSNSGLHSDVFQCYNPRSGGRQRWRFHRCLFYTHNMRSIRSNQGLFLTDARAPAFSGVDIQQSLFGAPNGNSRFGITVQLNGRGNVIRNNTLFGPISSSKKQPTDNSGTILEGNITSNIMNRGGGRFQSEAGNVVFRSPTGLFSLPAHGMNRGMDWRDYRAPKLAAGAREFLAHLEETWG